MSKFLMEQLIDEEKQIITSAINVYGDGDHPVATEQSLPFFKLSYIAMCLGRQHGRVIGSGMDKAEPDYKHKKLHQAHSEILDKIEDAIEFGG